MSKDNFERSLSLDQRRYLISSNLSKSFLNSTRICLICLIILSTSIAYANFTFQNEIGKYGLIVQQQIPNSTQTRDIFVPYSKDSNITPESIVQLNNSHKMLLLSSAVTALFLLFLLAWLNRGVYREHKKLKQLDKEYIRQSYILNFETQVPEGNSENEKILNQSILVFPDLKKLEGKSIKKGVKFPYSANYKITGDYYMDLMVDLDRKGLFVVKFFENEVKFSDVEELAKNISRNIKTFRVLCVAKKYDEIFRSEEIEKKMSTLVGNLDIDLIIEKENGYSMLWIS